MPCLNCQCRPIKSHRRPFFEGTGGSSNESAMIEFSGEIDDKETVFYAPFALFAVCVFRSDRRPQQRAAPSGKERRKPIRKAVPGGDCEGAQGDVFNRGESPRRARSRSSRGPASLARS